MNVEILLYFFVFLFGLCIGSFLNCAIYRLEEKKSLGGRSFCPRCKHALSWYDLFPVFSFIFLGGKCRYCKKSISCQYPLIELLTGVLFVLIFSHGLTINSIYLAVVSCFLIVIFVYDLKHYIIPDRVLFPAIAISLAYDLFLVWRQFYAPHGDPLSLIYSYALAVFSAAGFFLCIFLLSRGKWMGFGDVKLAILMGLLLGFSNVLAALFLAFFFGAIIGLILMIFQKKGLKSEIPFGPFLITGTFVAMLWGSQIIQWYLNILII